MNSLTRIPVAGGLLCCSLFATLPVTAQVIPDGTTSTTVNADGNNFEINNGNRAGGNLFHSFRDFSVPTGGQASFNNAADIVNILSRVTGGNISNINGLLKANGRANLFLINPTGIIFGEGASLDIGGSFYGSSADSILFEDGEFSATDLENPPVLTINAPIGLGFRDHPGDIIVRGDGQGTRTTSDFIDTNNALRVKPDKTFALVGGNLLFEGATIKTAGGRIELGSVEGNEQVSLTPVNEGFSLDYAGVQNFRDIQLVEQASVDASGEGGGDVFIQGKNITLKNGSQIDASTLGSLSGGSLNINAINTLEVNGTSNGETTGSTSTALATRTRTGATGIGGNLSIKAKDLKVTDGGLITSGAFGEGDGGSINIETERLTIDKDGQITASTFSSGDAGDLTVFASESVDITDTNEERVSAGLFSFVVLEEAKGNGGKLSISTSRFTLTGADVRAGVSTFGEGDGGDLAISTKQLQIKDGAELQAITFGNGNAGNIDIFASELIQVGGTLLERGFFGGVFASGIGGGVGNGGNLKIATDKLVVQDLGTISVSNFQTTGKLDPGKGAAGNLEINANSVEVNNGTITAANANGIGGSLTINTDSLSLDNQGSIEAFTTSTTGEGGIVNLNLDGNLFLRNNSKISARTENGAEGGIININANSVVAFPNQNNDIIADAVQGNGGDINITTEALLGLKEREATPGNQTNDIDVSSEFGLDGTVSITILEPGTIRGTTELPRNVIQAQQTTEQACSVNQETGKTNGLTVKGKGGVPPAPDLPLNADVLSIGGKIVANNSTANNRPQFPLITGKKVEYLHK
jgi:filamentous hemagglutinin family protein